MKKLLGIIVLSLLLSGNAFAQIKDIKKVERNIKNLNPDIEMIRVGNKFSTKADLVQAENICRSKNKFYFYFKMTTALERERTGIKVRGNAVYCSSENLFADPIFGHNYYNKLAYTNYDEIIAKSLKKNIVKSSEDIKDTLAQIKKMCVDFGYQEGTEKIADCMKEIYLKQTEQTTIIQGTTSTAKPKRKIDPTVWDDLLKLGGISSGSSSSSSSSSSSLKSTCYNTGEETGGMNKSCKYSCSGNIVTTTISSLEICPVKIQR